MLKPLKHTSVYLYAFLHLEIGFYAFLTVSRRFVHSDCGTKSIKVNRELSKFMQMGANTETIGWHFNPRSASHFGGV